MDASRRGVESYWRSKMIDEVTLDEDKVAPVYKLDEICKLLRASHVSVVKEIIEFIFKRLDHKSPIVKQKALRLIKYAVGKSGVEFKREMQKQSVIVRNLANYRGQPDPLRGDALNKAVRDTAQEASAAIFAAEDTKPASSENLSKRIQGFGNTNFQKSSNDKKSFIGEVVGLGSTTIKQGMSGLMQGKNQKKSDNGSYKGSNLRSTLTSETDNSDNRYEPVKYGSENQSDFGSSRNASSGPWNPESSTTNTDRTISQSTSSGFRSKTREERLLETIVTTGGVRLQPTRDALQVFLAEAAKVDAIALSHALESKLHAPQWQVRVKAICVLESILRKKDDEHFSVIASYFRENRDVVVHCSESPQASLRERATKVLNLLGGEKAPGLVISAEKQGKVETNSTIQMPDLIDTGDSDNFGRADVSVKVDNEQNREHMSCSDSPLIDDLLGDGQNIDVDSTGQENDDDPFVGVSFHDGEDTKHVDSLFSRMTVDDKGSMVENPIKSNITEPETFDFLASNSHMQHKESHKSDVNDLMAGLSINDKQKGSNAQEILLNTVPSSHPKVLGDSFSGILGSQTTGMNSNAMLSSNTLPYNIPPSILPNPAFTSQPINYAALGNYFAQQRLLATMSSLQYYGNLSSQSPGASQVSETKGEFSTPLPDIFQPNLPTQMPSSVMNSSKEETKAFDFITEHLATAQDSKRVA